MYVFCQYDDVVGGKFIVNVHYLEPELWVVMRDFETFQFKEAKEYLERSTQRWM